MSLELGLAMAVMLFGSEAGHDLVGCDWGRDGGVSTFDDLMPCQLQAAQRVVLHVGSATREVKLCVAHRDRIYAETDPHCGGAPE